jgi:hypothetical protein
MAKTVGKSPNGTSFLSRVLFIFVPICVVILGVIAVWQSNLAPMIHTAAVVKMDPAAVLRNKEAAREMFYHAYNNYLDYAFPKDELAPISCSGHDTENCRGCLLTFYDALDTLAVLGNRSEYQVHILVDSVLRI